MTVSLGGLSLILATIGLHGVLSHILDRRTREMGLRLALGARSSQVLWLAVSQGLRPVAGGVVIGIVLGTLGRVAIARWTREPVSLFDPIALIGLSVLFLVVGGAACAWPARRASNVDPNVALRHL